MKIKEDKNMNESSKECIPFQVSIFYYLVIKIVESMFYHQIR
ncbi:hypothetical protein CUZ95_2155 [Enterococcus lactis]|nr:hypothetical protein [Enterococcus lactis]